MTLNTIYFNTVTVSLSNDKDYYFEPGVNSSKGVAFWSVQFSISPGGHT